MTARQANKGERHCGHDNNNIILNDAATPLVDNDHAIVVAMIPQEHRAVAGVALDAMCAVIAILTEGFSS